MKITFLGAARTVTGSCYLIETEKTAFLVDCGMFQGRADEDANRTPFPAALSGIDFMLLTHAHIDHSGRIPKLWLDGYRNPVYSTKATADLCAIMLPDSGHIQEMDAEWDNRKHKRAGRPLEQPLYTHQDALDCLRLFKPQKYDKEFSPAQDVRVIFRDAGHILGSSIIELWVSEGGKETKVVFSGDLGNKGIPITRDPAIIDGADYLVLESTYGDRLHQDSAGRADRFVQIIGETVARGGNVVIPSFAVGRTQEIIYELNSRRELATGRLDVFMHTPVYVDSPLAISATQVFRENIDCFDEEARQYIERGDNPLDFPNLHFVHTMEESKLLNENRESKIIISASGMCDAGRVRHHLKHNLWRRESTILFVGFQAQGTLGRLIADGTSRVKLFGEEIRVNARVEMIEGFSGHADRDGLLDWVGAFGKKPSKIILVHGEDEIIHKFADTIRERFGIPTEIPSLYTSITLGAPAQAARSAEQASAAPAALSGRKLAAVELLDALDAEFESKIGELKEDLMKAADEADLEKVAVKIEEYGKYIRRYAGL
jgi:metallo-beta-lactamase family protein